MPDDPSRLPPIHLGRYAAVMRLGLGKPRIYLKERFPEGINLETCRINRAQVEQVDAFIKEGLETDAWVEVMVCPTYTRYSSEGVGALTDI